jgi:hypothetical protein
MREGIERNDPIIAFPHYLYLITILFNSFPIRLREVTATVKACCLVSTSITARVHFHGRLHPSFHFCNNTDAAAVHGEK